MIVLTQGERMHPLMVRLIDEWKKELAVLRARNDGALDAFETATIRGRIAQLKSHIALGDEPPVIDS